MMNPINPIPGLAGTTRDDCHATEDAGVQELDSAGQQLTLEVGPEAAEQRAMAPGWDQYIRDAVDVEWCTSRSYGQQLDEKAFYKRQAADRGLIDGSIEVRLDATVAGVEVPKRFRSTRDLRLAMTLNDPVDTTTDAVGIRAALSFDGHKYACLLPWVAIWAIATERGVACWREDIPPDVIARLDAPLAEQPAAPPRVYVPDPVIGPAVDELIRGVGAAYTKHKQEQMEEWERLEAADKTPVCAYSGYRAQRSTSRPTPEETVAFLADEREQLGMDRVAGTVVDPRRL